MLSWFTKLLNRLAPMIAHGQVQEQDPFPEDVEEVGDDEAGES